MTTHDEFQEMDLSERYGFLESQFQEEKLNIEPELFKLSFEEFIDTLRPSELLSLLCNGYP